MRSLIAAASLCALMCPALAQAPHLGAEVVAELKARGTDVSRRHAFEFYFYVADEAHANALARELETRGLATRVSRAPGDPSWLCLGTVTLVPDAARLDELGRFFDMLSQKYHSEFDGWEADPVP